MTAGITFFRFVTNHAFDRQMDGQNYIARPRLHSMQRGMTFIPYNCNARYSHEKAVCPSVRQTRGFWQNEKKMRQCSYITWKAIYPVFFYLTFWVKLTQLERKRRFSIDFRS